MCKYIETAHNVNVVLQKVEQNALFRSLRAAWSTSWGENGHFLSYKRPSAVYFQRKNVGGGSCFCISPRLELTDG